MSRLIKKEGIQDINAVMHENSGGIRKAGMQVPVFFYFNAEDF
jgi:hypothetical protein